MRKLIAVFIAISLLAISSPVLLSAKNKDPKHKTHKQKKAEKRQKKEWEKIRSRSNDFREKKGKHVGEHMLKKQLPAEQKKRVKHHLKPEGGTY